MNNSASPKTSTTPIVNSSAADSRAVERFHICILDNHRPTVEMTKDMLRDLGFTATGTCEPQEVLDQIESGRCRVVFCGNNIPEISGTTFTEQALHRDPGVYVILMADSYSSDAAIKAIKHGAYDYLPKPLEREGLKRTLADLGVQFHRRRRIHDLEHQLVSDLEVHGIVCRSPAMIELFELARKIARHYTTILIHGETGTGKRLIAQAIHRMSPAAGQRFSVCNCPTIAQGQTERHLFGRIGSFADADDIDPGIFEYTDGGTVFLDEVSEISLAMQSKVLRVIQEGKIERIGSPEAQSVSVRIIAATSRDLRVEALGGRFRQDFYSSLSGVQICVPSLRERLQDIPLLVTFFLKQYNQAHNRRMRGLTRQAESALLQHSWPGNIRELRNVIWRAALATTKDFLDLGDLPQRLQNLPSAKLVGGPWQPLPLDEVRQKHIQQVLELCGGNRVHAARMLRIGRTSLYRFLKRNGPGTNAAQTNGRVSPSAPPSYAAEPSVEGF